MKKNSDGQRAEFNPPAVAISRLLFVLMGVTAAAGCCVVLHSALAHRIEALLPGALLLAIAISLYRRLHVRGELTPILQSLENFGNPATAGDEFGRLVQAWEDLCSKRGSADFDPWKLLNLRREIETRVKENPALADYWRNHGGLP